MRLFRISIVCLLVWLPCFVACDSAAGNADLEKERNQLIWLLYQTGDADWYSVCTSSQTTALSCASSASASSLYIASLETIWAVSIENPQSSSEICNGANQSASFNKIAPGARSCYFRCQQIYWQNQSDSGNCTTTRYATALSNASAQSSTCFADCLQDDTRFMY